MKESEKHNLTDGERERVNKTLILKNKGIMSISELISMLMDPSWIVRRAVIEALAFLGDAAVGPLLDGLLHDRKSEAKIAATVDTLVASSGKVEEKIFQLANHDNPAVVADVAQILGRRRDPMSTPTLIQLLEHSNDNVAVGAIEGLGRIGGRAAVEALIAIVSSGNFFRTFPAIDVLGKSGDPRVIGPLTDLLKDPSFLPEAARALGRTGEKMAVAPLMGLINASSDSIIRLAALSLEELLDRYPEKAGGNEVVIGEMIRQNIEKGSVRRLARAISNSDINESIAICKILGIIGSDEAEPVLSSLLNGDTPLAACAAKSLKHISKSSDGVILQALKDGDSAKRKVLLPLIRKFSAAPDVALCLQDKDPEVRALACDSLARLGNAEVVKEIFFLLNDSNLRVVHSATAAIQALGNRDARLLAVEKTTSENPIVRRASLRILTYFGDSAAVEPMLKGLQDADPRVREAAVQGLPYLEDHRAIEMLYKICKSEDARMRSLAMRSLSQLPRIDERTYSVLLKGLKDADAWVRYYAVQSIGRLAFAPAAGDLKNLLEDTAGQVRVSVIEALSHLNVPEAHAALRAAAQSEDLEVKRAALFGLGIAHRADDLPIVISAVNSSDAPTRLMALSSLVSFPSPLILGTLSSAASDSDPQVRSAAIDHLGGVKSQEATEILIELLSNPSTTEKATAALLFPIEGRIPGILVALNSADDELSAVLVSILSRLKRPDARTALLSAMKLSNPAARKATASALAARRDPEMMAALKEAAEYDPDQEVRNICSLLYRQ